MWPVQMSNWILNFYLILINLNRKNHMHLVATVLDNTVLDTQTRLLFPPLWTWNGLRKVPNFEQSLTSEMSANGIKRRTSMTLLGSTNLMLLWAHKPNAINFLPREVTQANNIHGPSAWWGGRGPVVLLCTLKIEDNTARDRNNRRATWERTGNFFFSWDGQNMKDVYCRKLTISWGR